MRFHSIRDCLGSPTHCVGRFLASASRIEALPDLMAGSVLGGQLKQLYGRSVLIMARDQLAAAIAMIELDGIARRLILWPLGVSAEHVSLVAQRAQVDVIVSDEDPGEIKDTEPLLNVHIKPVSQPHEYPKLDPQVTEWVLLTSGTSGVPKMVAHSFDSLTAAIQPGSHDEMDVVWGTFYDIRRYGGLQIFLRALLGRGSLVLSSPNESPGEHLRRLAAHSVTHLTGTPSHWRRALMSSSAHAIAPRYVRLSGEIADQAILNSLHSFYPDAAGGHAYASTEAGVAFEVNDGFEGFPSEFVGTRGNVEIKIESGSLQIRSNRTAACYLGEAVALRNHEDFVDTGDIVERRGDRYYFLGRKSGVINVGGQKVFPEEVEALLNRHPAVRMSCVRPRRSPITGSLVVADVVLKDEQLLTYGTKAELANEILKLCRETLPQYKVPMSLNFVPILAVGAAGKISRSNA